MCGPTTNESKRRRHMLPTDVKNERGRCSRCGRSFNLTRNGTMRKHKCSAAAPLAMTTSKVATPVSSTTTPGTSSDQGEGGADSSLMVWKNIGLCLTRIWKDGMAAAFVTSVRTASGLFGLELDAAGAVTSTCPELQEVGRGCILVGIGDRVLQQPPLEPLPAKTNATDWLRGRLRAYREVGWDRVPVLCHGPVPMSLRRTLQDIQRKEQWSRNDTMLVQMTLMTVTDRELAAFDAAKTAEERRAAEARRSRNLLNWRSSLPPSIFSAEEEEEEEFDVDRGEATTNTSSSIYAHGSLVPWLISGGLVLDTLCALRATAKSVARFLSSRVRELAASNFRRDRLDLPTMIRQRSSPSELQHISRQAIDYARRFKGGADRFYDFVSSRFANVASLELPILPGATEIGVRQIAFALGPKLRVLKLIRWDSFSEYDARQQSPFLAAAVEDNCLLAGGDGGALDVLTAECDNLSELVVHTCSGHPYLPPAPRAWFEQRLGCLRVLDLGNVEFDAPLRVSELPRLVDLAVAHLPDLGGSSAVKRIGPTSLRIYGAHYSEAAIRDWALAAVATPFAEALDTFSVATKPAASSDDDSYSPTRRRDPRGSRGDDDVGDAAIRALCAAFPRIRHFSVRGSRAFLRPETTAELRRLDRLRTLDLSDSPSLDAGCLPHLPPRLTLINLSGCNSLLSTNNMLNETNDNRGPYHLPASTASSRFARDIIAPISAACPRARIKAHIEPSYSLVLCAEFREQAAKPTEIVCKRCFCRVALNNNSLYNNNNNNNNHNTLYNTNDIIPPPLPNYDTATYDNNSHYHHPLHLLHHNQVQQLRAPFITYPR